jgi:hypothetical protein
MLLLNLHYLALSDLLYLGHNLVMTLFPYTLNYTPVAKVDSSVSLKFIVLYPSNIKLVPLFPFIVAGLNIGFLRLMASDDTVVRL